MSYKTVELKISGELATVALNRVPVRNALNDQLIAELQLCFDSLIDNSNIRVIILTGKGSAFCAGADLNWMQDVLSYSFEENVEDSMRLSDLVQTIYTCPKPVIGKINGAAIGGGTGLVAACDIAIASEEAIFGFTESKLGLAPAIIAPYLLKRIGEKYLREYFLTGERFSASDAKAMGLINRVAPAGKLDAEVLKVIEEILTGAPKALEAAKEIIRLESGNLSSENRKVQAEIISRLRLAEEGQEGMQAFLQKRKPNWISEKK
jgi:methylglutaconyl-CoA hydratase